MEEYEDFGGMRIPKMAINKIREGIRAEQQAQQLQDERNRNFKRRSQLGGVRGQGMAATAPSAFKAADVLLNNYNVDKREEALLAKQQAANEKASELQALQAMYKLTSNGNKIKRGTPNPDLYTGESYDQYLNTGSLSSLKLRPDLKTVNVGGVTYAYDQASGENKGAIVDPETVAETAGDISSSERGAANRQDRATDLFKQAQELTSTIPEYEGLISAIDQGAWTGKVSDFLPTIRQGSILFNNVKNRLGLKMLNTFLTGPASDTDVKLLQQTAVPPGLSPAETRKWAQDRIAAQQRLANGISAYARFLENKGTESEWYEMQEELNRLEKRAKQQQE
ncbi:hypothetical protein M0G74_09050 [Microbulbifer sp. CAU 1566]|uniref:hypothetical protein n=1 Tax=Microbulbifer sp. CAU 1566 TaxID=2933269 RepID=UPI002002A8CA|nr:hypothetical protein [Microbulbifer sp. CAU 1566]MCK7597413.1 hypothetical protein [Microbulbifer sp. CAU 1566]